MLDRTSYLPGTMTLARKWSPRPQPGSSLETYRAWLEVNVPGGEFNEALAQLEVESDLKGTP